jgi:hypothetical protein
LELRVKNNILHLRTCSDTFKALAELINYIASDGDLKEGNAEENELQKLVSDNWKIKFKIKIKII